MDLPAIGEVRGEDSDDEREETRLVEEETLLEERDEEAEIARGQFQLQCGRLIESIVVSSRDVNELIAVYNEINSNMLPLSLKLTLGLLCSRLFRSMGDLDDTACELSRLIELYSAPWDGRAEALRRLHAQYRRNCRLLNAAIRKLHLATANSEQFRAVRVLNKWEQLFSVVMQAKGIGRKWKFKMTSLRNAASLGPEAVEAYLANERREANLPIRGGSAEKATVLSDNGSDALVSKVQEDKKLDSGEEKEDDEDEEDEYDDEDDDSDVSFDESRLKHTKGHDTGKKSVRFSEHSGDELADEYGFDEEYPNMAPVKTPPQMEDVGCWTHEPEMEKRLVIRLFRPTNLRIATGNKGACYLLRPCQGSPIIMGASSTFYLNTGSASGPNADNPVGDFVTDARVILPDEAQLELNVGDKSVAAGALNLRQMAASDPAPVTLENENTPVPEDYPYAVRMNVPMYSTSLGASVRVSVGIVPIAIFGIRYEIFPTAECGIMTDLEEYLFSAMATPSQSGEPRDGAPVESAKEPAPPQERPASGRSVGISPIRWDAVDGVDGVDREVSDVIVEAETVEDLKRKFQEQERNMSQSLRAMEAELRKLRQRQSECDFCSGRARLYGQMSGDTRVSRATGQRATAGSRSTAVTQGTPIPPVRYATADTLARERTNDSIVTLPAIYMPSQLGHAYNARASSYFHPLSHTGRRVTQPPSVFAMHVPSEGGAPLPSTVNLYSLAMRQTEPVVADQRLKLTK